MDALGGSIHLGYWDSPEDNRDVESATDRMTTMVAEKLMTNPGQRILDVGCGTGKPAMQIAAAHNISVTGITNSSRQVELARGVLNSGPQQVEFQLADAMELPFPDAFFDGAYAVESLIHMEQSTALEQIARVLRPGSRLVIADVFHDDGSTEGSDVLERLMQVFQVTKFPTAGDYRDLLHQAGFEVVEFKDIRQNIARSFDTIVMGLRQANFDGDMGKKIDEVIADLSKVNTLKQFGYALITAERKK